MKVSWRSASLRRNSVLSSIGKGFQRQAADAGARFGVVKFAAGGALRLAYSK